AILSAQACSQVEEFRLAILWLSEVMHLMPANLCKCTILVSQDPTDLTLAKLDRWWEEFLEGRVWEGQMLEE
ncbi:hypothetical protein LTR16_004190, partial [Cryomyces antarcticus]